MSNVTIATTMWSEVSEETGRRREQELGAVFWEDMIFHGCKTKRFEDTGESAWDIVGKNSPTILLLQQEMVDVGKSLQQTDAYDILDDGLPKWLGDFWKRAFCKVR